MTDRPDLPPFYRLIALESVGSTNAEATKRAAAGAAAGTLVWSLEQTAGRGRRGREWASPPGNLYCSLILRPTCSAAAAVQLSFVTALAIAETVRESVSPSTTVCLKWPNDVLLNGRKVSGILLESTPASGGHRLEWMVIGAGINLISAPENTRHPATCLAAEGGAILEPARALEAYAGAFATWYTRWQQAGFAPVRAAWLALATGIGEPIRVRLADETLEGRFAALADDGALILELPDGSNRSVTTGDVFSVAA